MAAQDAETVVDFSPHEVELAAALGRALGNDELTVVYQPLVRCGEGETVGVEALLRWERPGLGTVHPSDFIPVAERAGLMVGIGRWALRTACDQLASWHAEGLGRDLILHVNLSSAELHDRTLLDTVSRTLAETGVSPIHLCFEIQESMLRPGEARADAVEASADAVLRGLEELGVQLCLHDFGTSSSIDAITRYQFDYAKVGRGLTGGVDSPHHRARLVRGLLGMARALGTTLIAEGVERGDELDRIAALGVVKVQGYATGRPATGADLGRALAAERSWDFASVG